MQKDKVTEVLRSLATGDKNRSETARLRDVFDDVEAALQAGVVRTAILEALNAQGFTMTLKSFESALYRIRKQRAARQVETTTPANRPASKPTTSTPGEPKKTETALTKPVGFDFKGTRDDKDLF